MLRPCIDCGKPGDGPRCPQHAPAASGKPSARARGYDAAHDRLSRRARRLQPCCADCGRPDDLQLHHKPEAWQRKAAGKIIRLQDVEVLCGDCNRRRGPARGLTPRGGDPDQDHRGPHRQANFGSENGFQLGQS